MMIRTLVLLLLCLPLWSQADDADFGYYGLRPDLRKCASPLCGGYFVHTLNRLKTLCADGKRRSECYVAEVDLAALGLSEAQSKELRSLMASRRAIVRGRLRQKPFEGFGNLGELVAGEAWTSATGAAPRSLFYRALDQGIVCIAFPCLSYREELLNNTAGRDLAGVDLSRARAGESQLTAAQRQLSESNGILVAGSHARVTGPAGRAWSLIAKQFYLPVVAAQSQAFDPATPAIDPSTPTTDPVPPAPPTTDPIPPVPPTTNPTPPVPPTACYVGGCSSQLCSADPDVATTCEWRPEYACYQAAACARQADGHCGWTPSATLQTCLEEAGKQQVPVIE